MRVKEEQPAAKADRALLTESSSAVQRINVTHRTRNVQHEGIFEEEQGQGIDTDSYSEICKIYSKQNGTENKKSPYHRCASSDDASDTLLTVTISMSESDDEISLTTETILKRKMSLDEGDASECSKQEIEMLLHNPKDSTSEFTKEETASNKEFDVSAYMNWREMTPLQERINAITVVPNPCFCFYFLLAGKWLGDEVIERAREAMEAGDFSAEFNDPFFLPADEASHPWISNMMKFDPSTIAQGMSSMSFYETYENFGCIRSSMFPSLHALPPLPVLAVAIGIILHMPFSFTYHWTYAHRLPPGLARIEHWSRRLDHAFIHVISTCMSYGTSGSFNYFLACALFNTDCIYRQFVPKVRPRENKIRIAISIIAYIMPILQWGNVILFAKVSAIFLVSAWLFASYPIGGWSHSFFHATIALIPPLLMTAACHLPASRAQIQTAAMCAVLQEEM